MLSLISGAVATVTLVAAIVPSIVFPTAPRDDAPLFPAPSGYLLPRAGGEIHDVTQGEETSFTHNGRAAYAFDFNLDYDTVVAARSGRVLSAFDGSNSGGCDGLFTAAANYVVIDHGDGTSGLYLHLAFRSAQVKPGDLVAQGHPIAVSGETGFTCTEDDAGPAPHLHFQVQRTDEKAYFSQSLPITFDDVPRDDGVPREGKAYASGNYGRGKPQKLPLTPRRVERRFNPTARPRDPALAEAQGAQPLGAAESPPLEWPTATETPAPTETPWSTDTPEPTRTPTRTPTPPPTALPPTDTPAPSPSATAAPPTATEPPASATTQPGGTATP